MGNLLATTGIAEPRDTVFFMAVYLTRTGLGGQVGWSNFRGPVLGFIDALDSESRLKKHTNRDRQDLHSFVPLESHSKGTKEKLSKVKQMLVKLFVASSEFS